MAGLPSYLILMLTNRCNLSCRYCYLGDLRKAPEQGRDMDNAMIDKALAMTVRDQHPLHVQLSGGEPFLVPHQVAHAARMIRRIHPSATLGIQTNGTCLNPPALDLIRECELQVGVSLDGDPPVQEATRGRAAQTFRGLNLLEAARIPFNVTCVVSSANAQRLHRLVLALGGFSMARGIGLDLLVVKGRASRDSVLPAEPAQIRSGIQQMRQALAMVNQGRTIPIVIREMEKIRESRQTPKAFCNAALGKSLVITPEGDFFPCSQTAYDPRFFMGSLDRPGSFARAGLLKPLGLALSLSQLMSAPPKQGLEASRTACLACPLDGVCPGDCPSRLHYNRNRGVAAACSLYQALAASETFHNKTGV